MEYFKDRTAEIINYTFQTLLVTYLILLLAEQIWPKFVTHYLDLNYLLILVIISGILDVFSEHKKETHKTSWKDYTYISILAILGFVIIKYKTVDLGWLSWVISIIAGILIYLLSILILDEKETEEDLHLPKIFHNKIILTSTIIAVLLLITIILNLTTSLLFLESARIVFGSVYVLFLPGFIISYIFFPRIPKKKIFNAKKNLLVEKKEGIDTLERIALSFALSIAVVPLIVFYLNLIGIKINTLNVALIILVIIIISSLILFFVNFPKKPKGL